MNGKVIPLTPLAVDFWKVRKCSHVRLFFLSHMHSDHTVSLTSTWCNRPIYCSSVTAKLLKLKLQVDEQWIHPLEIGEPCMLPLDDIGKESLTVTLIDANHCPGAVMFLFQGYFGCILYTGDFRYTASMLQEPCLSNNITIDVLYLDNTNCDPTRTLPSRQQATQQIKEIIRAHPNHTVVIGLYTLGKECLLVELAFEFKTWVEVSYERLEILEQLDLPHVFTIEPGAGRIRVVEQSQIRFVNLIRWNREQPTLAILPTSRPISSFHPDVHVVPYSDHSSYQELEDFVSALQPCSLVPIVGTSIPCGLLPRRTPREVSIPESVQHYMSVQMEVQLRSPGHHRPSRRLLQRGPPRGVVFESPEKGSGASSRDTLEAAPKQGKEEDKNLEVDGDGSDCALMGLSDGPSLVKAEGGSEDVCSLEVVQDVSLRLPQVAPFTPLDQSNFTSMGVMGESEESTAQVQDLPHIGDAASSCEMAPNENGSGPHSGKELYHTLLFETGSSGGDTTLTECERTLLRQLPFTEENFTAQLILKDKRIVQQFCITPFLKNSF